MGDRVVVAMSGGVDSSVAAALLVEQGYEVIGVMMRLWAELGRGEGSTNKCCSLESVYDARAVAERLAIPFYLINVERPFKSQVVDPFIAGYAAGHTPNPCLSCNRQIRFGYLLKYAQSLGARFLATGHYARVSRDSETGAYLLRRGIDRDKDQSYVLHVLGQAELAGVLFPVGSYTKPEVRALAAQRGLPTASRVESQDLCFIADGDYRRFLQDWAPEAIHPGPILDRQGRQLGSHRGLPFYTIGQRSGLGIASPRPLYVLALDQEKNALIVGTAEELGSSRLRAGRVNWSAGRPPSRQFEAGVQIRYRSRPAPATISVREDGYVDVDFANPVRDIMPGQYAVFYDDDLCLGGGEIIPA